MSSAFIDVSEVTALAATLTGAAATIDTETGQSERNAAEATELRAKQLVPVATGELRASIHTEGSDVIADAPHAAYVEFGTSRSGPQPFMFSAGDLGERILEELVAEDGDPFGT